MLVYLEEQKELNRYCLYLNTIFISGKQDSYWVVHIKGDNSKIDDLIKDGILYKYISVKELEELLKNS